jgi:proteasome lid subunit RPN8/RPN11
LVVDRLVLPEALRQELLGHAREGNPNEVCGVLAGADNRVERVYPVRNIANSIKADDPFFRDRQTDVPADGQLETDYFMDPMDYKRVEDEIDAAGLKVVGLYHSHTHSEARPSATDIRLANWLEVCYVLVSLTDVQQPPVRAWRIVKDSPFASTGDVLEVPLA